LTNREPEIPRKRWGWQEWAGGEGGSGGNGGELRSGNPDPNHGRISIIIKIIILIARFDFEIMVFIIQN
jgi:hypothetical protein